MPRTGHGRLLILSCLPSDHASMLGAAADQLQDRSAATEHASSYLR
jgi:hypothetical protein